MYVPYEAKYDFPEQPDENATWQTVWDKAFMQSGKCLLTGEGCVPASFGLQTLRFAEMAAQSYYEKNGALIENKLI